jgi:hypothetical protein
LHYVCALDNGTRGSIEVACSGYLESSSVEPLSENIKSTGVSLVSINATCLYYSVVFPLPLAPIIAVRVPRGISVEILCKSDIEHAPISTSTESVEDWNSLCTRLGVLEAVSHVTERFRICLIRV